MLRHLIPAMLLAGPAMAAPPPGADPTLAPFYHGLKQPKNGVSCCDEADCRPVVTRTRDGHTEAFIGGQFYGAPNEWRVVPEDVVIHGKANPVGEPILCYAYGTILCFLLNGGV